ncbi:hypothetical protein IQ218_14395, partial [Synechocystis salina LEGE 06099]|nr:hypothetical protein [Synechocystis salina LEGE 06099]
MSNPKPLPPQSELDNIRRYDVKAIANYYRRRPWKVLGRALEVLWSFGF